MRFGRIRASALAFGLAGMLGLLTVLPALAANTTVTVTPADMQGWFFCNDQTNCVGPATGSMVSGPGSPPLGVGSARLPVSGPTDGQALILGAYQGTKLASITKLEYSTYRVSGDPALAIALQFNIDSDVTDANNAYQGRLVFEPYQSGATVVTGQWQTWDPTAGKWWGTGSAGRPISQACPQSSPCTWQQILTQFPNAGIHSTFGAVVFKAGSGWNAFNGNVDAFTIGVNGNNTTYDFEPYAVAKDKDDCKKDGWKDLRRADGSSFKNQGDCVSYTNNGK